MKFNFTLPEDVYHKTSFVVIKLSNNAPAFLSGLVANDLNSNETVFTDINGKTIAHTWVKKSGDDVFLLVNKPYDEALLKHLNKYLRLSTTKMMVLNETVYHLFSDRIFAAETIELNAGKLVWGLSPSAMSDLQPLDEDSYCKIRLYSDIPVQGIDFDNNMLLELNRPQLISYDKGCYLGQEIIARVTSRGKIPTILKRIVAKSKPESDEQIEVKSTAFFERQSLWLSYVFVKHNAALVPGMENFSNG